MLSSVLRVIAPSGSHADMNATCAVSIASFGTHALPPQQFLSIQALLLNTVRAVCTSNMAKYKPGTRVGVSVLFVPSNWHLE